MIHKAHYGPLPPIWDLLDKPSNTTLPLLSLEEFTGIMNRCAPNALRIVCLARYLELKTQEIHEALEEAHSAMSLAKMSETRLPETNLASPSRTQRLPLDTRTPWPAPLPKPSAPVWLSKTTLSCEDNSP